MSRKDKLRKVMKDCGIVDKQTAEQVLQARNVMYNIGFAEHTDAVKKAVDAKAEEIRHDVISLLLAHNIVVVLNVLHTKWGFGAKRMRDFIEYYFKFSEVMTDPARFGVETPDICRQIKEESGFDIQQEIMDYDKREKLEEKHNDEIYGAFTGIATTNLQIRIAMEYALEDGRKIVRAAWKNNGKKPFFLYKDKHGNLVDDCADEYTFDIEDIVSDDWEVIE